MKSRKKSQTIAVLILIIAMTLSTVACSNTAGSAVETVTTATAPATSISTNTPADISGEINEIIGNEITLRLYAENELITEESRVPGSGRGATTETIAREYSGEQVTFIIPVGTLIVKRVRQTEPTTSTTGTGTGPVEEEIGLDDLTVGTQLKVYYKEGTDNIEKVVAVPPRA